MTKADLINQIAETNECTKKDAEKALSAVLTSITDALVKGERVQLIGFGTFEVRERAAKTGTNPLSKKEYSVPAKKAPAFKAGKALKEAVNK